MADNANNQAHKINGKLRVSFMINDLMPWMNYLIINGLHLLYSPQKDGRGQNTQFFIFKTFL